MKRASVERIVPWQPFPTDRLPASLRAIVEQGAERIGVDPTFVLLPALVAASTAIGNSRRIVVNSTWGEPATVWAAVVGEPGSRKTPAYKTVMRPLEEHQDLLDAAHVGDDEAPREVCFVTDCTLERLAGVLQENPRGVGMLRDELSNWFAALTKYRREGSDAPQWLELFNDGRLHVHRKTGTPRYVAVRSANVPIFGGVQPAILERCLAGANTENGLASRFLLAHPPRVLLDELPQGVDQAVSGKWAVVIRRLLRMEMSDDGGTPKPIEVPMTPEADAVWRTFYKAHQERIYDSSGPLAAALSKQERYAPRLALIFHLIEQAADPLSDGTDSVTGAAMRQAVAAVEWFAHEAERIYGRWAQADDERSDAERAFQWLEARGGRGTLRAMLRQRIFADADEGEQALAELNGAGLLTVETTRRPGPGRPSTEYVLKPGL